MPSLGDFVTSGLSLLEGTLLEMVGNYFAGTWGIYDKNKNKIFGSNETSIQAQILKDIGVSPILSYAGISAPTVSFIGIEYRAETKISDFPVARGQFATYNKVNLPATPVITLAMTGSKTDMSLFLETIDKACKSIDLYDIVTPDKIYIDHSIERYNYSRRAEKGATLLTVEIFLKEVKQVDILISDTNVVSPKDAGSSAPVSTGAVQAQPSTQTIEQVLF